MRSRTRIALKNGDVHWTTETPGDVVSKSYAAQREGDMIQLESTRIPTGQMFYLNPTEIASVDSDE